MLPATRTNNRNLSLERPLLGSSLLDDFFNLDNHFLNRFSSYNRDIYHNMEDGTLEIEVPGYSKEDINVKVQEDGTLHIKGENKNRGSFEKYYRIKGLSVNDDMEARCENGILTLKTKTKEKAREIKIT